jgi:predicted metallopeptidase
MPNHHPTSVSTSRKKTAAQIFGAAEPILRYAALSHSYIIIVLKRFDLLKCEAKD